MCAVCEMRKLGSSMRRLKRLVVVALVGVAVVTAMQGDGQQGHVFAAAAPLTTGMNSPAPAAGVPA